ncbi:MAG: tRNA (adenosine(37)-N6)-threonylcarbamoyltransferase complex dimerization subunit type 1 TsaB [Glaciecola sp.]
MNIVVLDTATEACSVAVNYNDTVVGQFTVSPQQQSVNILPMLQAVLDEAGMAKSAIQGIGFGQGPGSFTGVRIAMGMTQGLALGLDIPVVGVSTLAAMAQEAFTQAPELETVYAAIDARMDEVYFAQYRIEKGLVVLQGNEQVIPPEVALSQMDGQIGHLKQQLADGKIALVGTGWEAYTTFAELLPGPIVITLPNARFMLPLVEDALAQNKGVAVEDAQPQYVRDTVTWKKLPGR